MDKENGDGGGEAAKPPPDSMLDPSGLFGAYWGRDGGGGGAAAQAQAQAALFGFGSRYPPPTTLGVAANQAASLGLHPAASAAWWSMASHLAAQDYLARLQASGLNFPPMADPYAALSALSAMKQPQKPAKPPSRNDRSGRSSSSSVSAKDKSPSTNTASSQPSMRSSYGFPKTSSPSTMSSPSLSSLASLNNLAQQPLHSKPSKQQPLPSRKSSSSSSSSKEKERDLALLRGDLMLAQAAAHGAYHAAVAAAKGKNMSPLYPFGMSGSEKDRRSGIDSLTGLPHNILSDPSSVLGGVRLPPDTEIIKYTSSLAGPKVPPGTTNRGRKKTISLDPPQVSVHPSSERAAPLPSKRQKVDEYGNSRSSVEVIRLPTKPERANSVSGTPPPNLADYAGISRELLQTIASQSGVSLAALERQLAGSTAADSGLNLSTKSNNTSAEESPLDLGTKGDDEAPLNLSLKPTPPSTQASDALSRLTSLSSSLNASNDRISRRKPGAKPRRVAPEGGGAPAHSPRPTSSGSEDSEAVSSWGAREGRPRNLGRGVSKPKKNTVASLLAQSRALGLRPALAQQLLGETDLEKLRALVGEGGSTDSCASDSAASDSETGEPDPPLRLPLALGWRRVTLVRGLSRKCHVRGDVSYSPPEPHAALHIKSPAELQTFLEANPCPPLCRDNFSFCSRTILGEYIQPATDGAEPTVLTEAEITKRVEEARAACGRPTPPPLERRMELARRQQAQRDARAQQARLVRELERSEKAEYVKREKEARSQQLLEQINRGRSQLTIEALPAKPDDWKGPDGQKTRDKTMPQISLSLIPVSGLKDSLVAPNEDWKETEQYNALDKMKDFAEKAAFDLPKRPSDRYFDFSLMKTADKRKAPEKENNIEKLIESYSRISEFINGCEWSKGKEVKKSEQNDPQSIEQKYLDAKNEFMSQNLALMPKDKAKEVIDLSEDDILNDIISKRAGKETFNVGKDGALSISVHKDASPAKKKKQEEAEKQKMEDQAKRQQERELKRHQAMLLKEQERERRRQHTTFIRQLDGRRRWEERERRKHQNLLDRLLVKEKKLQQRRKEMELLAELRRPQEDSTLSDHKPLPALERLPARIAGQAMADLLHVFEFLHNFGQALGFDVESLPNLDTLQQGLIPNFSQEAEDQLITVMTRLLIIAIEDPGIPHPGRHTTLLGHAIRMGDVTPANLSEVLRIYLYANATGEVKALTGLTVERERERRVADHHQSDAEMTHANATTKNPAYYDHLHNNATYKLSETLRDKPFVALNPTTKARMMARVCDELTQSRAVLRQLDAALDQLAQLRRERFTLDTRIRKITKNPQDGAKRAVRSLHQRKLRTEQTEKQQAMALERMQRLVEESSVTRTSPDDDRSDKSETPKKRDKESSPDNENSKQNTPSPYKEPPTDESDKELSPLKDLSNSIKSKEMLNNNKDECSPNDPKIDKDSVMGDCDANLSDLESEGTQPEEDEDKNLSSEELSRKLDKLMRQSEQQLQALAAASHALRATCFGQDRYWRRYWSLGKCGGVYVEAMESAQPEIMDYHAKLEADALCQNRPDIDDVKKGVSEWSDSAMRAEELRSIKTELNLSDRTQIIKYEPNLERQGDAQGSRYMCGIKMEEKYIQEKSHGEEDMLDIEDSIPTAFLVQKPTHKPMYPQPEPAESPEVKPEPVKTETVEKEEPEESKENLVNNLEELRKMAEAVSSQLDAAKKAEIEKTEVKEEVNFVLKDETVSPEEAHSILYIKITEGKWFSILRHERFLTSINEEQPPEPEYRDNEHTCAEIITTQGHRWDVSNNLHLLNDPSLFTLNSMVTSVQVPSNNVYADSSLTMSGLDQEMMDASLSAAPQPPEKEQENDLEKELQADAAKDLATQKSKASGLTSLGMLNFNALSTYVTCDSPPPIQMTPEEQEQLEHCKVHGLPKKLDTQYVPKDLRYGWWRITDPDQMQEVMRALHPRGVRERELHAALAHHLLSFNNKIHIEKGIPVAQLEGPAGETPEPDAPGSFCTAAARRVDMQLLAAVEALEERVAAGSMQVKGWRPARQTRDSPPPAATGALIVARARDQLAALEAHIERRYLKPPLVHSTADANIGAVLQAEHGNAPATSPHSDTTENKPEGRGVARGLATWREGVSRCNTSAQLAMMLAALDSAVAWDKSIMKATMPSLQNCQFCQSGDNEAELLLCDGCDKGYHTYCFKPRMDKIPEGDWYCWECVNKARGQRVCIVCGGGAGGAGRLIPCALCSRAYHHDCHYPPLPKNPRGKWYCSQCISRAPPKKPRKASKRDSKSKDTSLDLDAGMVPSPAASHASTSTTAEEASVAAPVAEPDPAPEQAPPEPAPDPENGLNHTSLQELSDEPPEKRRATHFVAGNGALQHDETDGRVDGHVPDPEVENIPLLSRAKKDKGCAKKMSKEMQFCKNLLCEMECHEHAWPFLLPVNTKQFPQYRKVIKCPMDLSTIKRKLQDSVYKCKEEFASDVRLIFSNCEVFNEDDSPVGRAGHSMRQFFETRWP